MVCFATSMATGRTSVRASLHIRVLLALCVATSAWAAIATWGIQPAAPDTTRDLVAALSAPIDRSPDDGLVVTSSGVRVGLDREILTDPATQGARSMQEAAELWADYLTAPLSDAEKQLLREQADAGTLGIKVDTDTGQFIAVRLRADGPG